MAFCDAVEACEREGTRCPFYLGKVPLQQELPEIAQAIDECKDASPGAVLGDCFGPLIPEGIFTYYGCGHNVSATHYDPHENMMLCVCGTKRVWLYPPSDLHCLYPHRGDATQLAVSRLAGDYGASNKVSRSVVPPFKTHAQLSGELQATFPKLAHARPVEAVLHAGDALYLPMCWWHCVEGSHERNCILNWWFLPHPRKAQLDEAGG